MSDEMTPDLWDPDPEPEPVEPPPPPPPEPTLIQRVLAKPEVSKHLSKYRRIK